MEKVYKAQHHLLMWVAHVSQGTGNEKEEKGPLSSWSKEEKERSQKIETAGWLRRVGGRQKMKEMKYTERL